MSILITGGSGFLGINIIRYLLEKGHDNIRSLDIADFDYPEKNDIEIIAGDIRNGYLIRDIMKNTDVLIHTAAALPLYKKRDIFSTDVDGTKNLLEAAKKNGVERFVMVSSTAVYGIPDHHPLTENDTLTGVGHYGEAKIQAEELCNTYRDGGMCVPILRPKTFIGPERLGVFAILYEWANDGKNFPMIGNGSNRYQLLDVYDLCAAIYLSMTGEKEAVNHTFNIGAESFATMKEDWQAVLDKAGFGRRIVSLPSWPVITTLRLLEFVHLSPLYKWVYETANKDSFVSIDRAKEKLGYKPIYSNSDALVRNYLWYLGNVGNFAASSGITHRAPWKQGALKFAKFFF